MIQSRFDLFVGVDQNGSTVGGKPKPLTAAAISFRYDRVALEALELPSLSQGVIMDLAAQSKIDIKRIAIVVDCIMGLPARALSRRDFWKMMRSTQNFEGYGSKVAKLFFDSIYKHESISPKRHVEELIGAQSAFSRLPFQRNIQSGSFRIWKELSLNKRKWFNIWPYDLTSENPDLPWVFEGHPIYYWRERFARSRREPKALREIFDIHRVDLPQKLYNLARRDPDFADAACLALGAFLDLSFQDIPPLPKIPRIYAKEGWILGVQSRRLPIS